MRLKFIVFLVILVWGVLLFRVYDLAIVSNKYFEEKALTNAVKTELLPPTRGQITDSKNRPVAINKLGFSISIAPHLSDEKLTDEVERIFKFFPFPMSNPDEIYKEYKRQNSFYNHEFIKVIDFLDYSEVLPYFSLLNLSENLSLSPASMRYYPYESLASHIIGYVGRANSQDIQNDPTTKITNFVGRSGIERYYNTILQGEIGERKTKVTALNRVVEEVSYTKPQSSDISLTIDMELQEFITELFKDKAGAVVVMDVDDGAVLAAGSFPEYDLNPFVTGISSSQWNAIINDLDHPFTNKLINGLYPPGSVIKMGVGLAFLSSGKIGLDKSYYCSGKIELGGRNFRCWKAWGHGNMDLVGAIRESCDVYFYEGSLEIGIDFMAKILRNYGFGKKTGIDLPNEFVGTIPDKEWKMAKFGQPWYMGETVNASIGQGNVLVTPMQMAKHTAEIASGKGITPHFLKSVDGEDVKFENFEIFTPFEKSMLPYIRKGMYEVANHPKGTAYRLLKDSVVEIAAKTGTAQVVGIPQNEIVRMKEKDMEYYHRSHAWLTSYGPFNAPKYAVVVLVEHGGGGGSAGSPIIKEIYKKLVELGYIEIEEK
ncbi:MAG: penicillin-binding protein 2 [Campylobacter sp.]|nr:penicillin-binding protein 2 [Campylobacter sp.]